MKITKFILSTILASLLLSSISILIVGLTSEFSIIGDGGKNIFLGFSALITYHFFTSTFFVTAVIFIVSESKPINTLLAKKIGAFVGIIIMLANIGIAFIIGKLGLSVLAFCLLFAFGTISGVFSALIIHFISKFIEKRHSKAF